MCQENCFFFQKRIHPYICTHIYVLLDRPKVLELISDHRLIHFDISKHQLPCKPTIIKFRKVNDIPSQVIKQEISDVLNLCDGIKDPNIYLESANKAWLTALNKITPEKGVQEERSKKNPLVQC